MGAALCLVLVLSIGYWQQPSDDSLTEQMGTVRAITWDNNVLRLEGMATAGATVAATLDGAALVATVNDAGVFVLEISREQRLPTRLQLTVEEQVYDLLITRWQKRFVVLQRRVGDVPWVPVVGYNAPTVAGAAVVMKVDDAYGVTFYLPSTLAAETVYVYADNQLVHTAPAPKGFVTVTMPLANAVRLDVYDAKAVLQQRAQLLLPPEAATSRYGLNDGTVWLFTNLMEQKAKIDELIPGQFIPVSAEEVLTPSDKDVPPAHTAPAR